jgi:hypothetical protein
MIVPGIQVRIPAAGTSAQKVIERMKATLDARFKFQINRREFLRKWAGHRKALFLTTEYQMLREHTFNGQGGKCIKCGVRPCVHLHHKVRVVDDPTMAVHPGNVVGLCARCHRAEPHSPLHTRTIQFTNRDATTLPTTEPTSPARSAVQESSR